MLVELPFGLAEPSTSLTACASRRPSRRWLPDANSPSAGESRADFFLNIPAQSLPLWAAEVRHTASPNHQNLCTCLDAERWLVRASLPLLASVLVAVARNSASARSESAHSPNHHFADLGWRTLGGG